jgi:hypothetical protein
MASMSQRNELANGGLLTFAIANMFDDVVVFQSLDDTTNKDLGTLRCSVHCHQSKWASWLRHIRLS